MIIPTLHDLAAIRGKKILVRLDLNTPIKEGKVVDDFRITQSLPTINYLKDKGAKIIIISHIEGSSETLRPAYEYLQQHLSISFCPDLIEKGEPVISNMHEGDILLCENIRQYPGEKDNDKNFTKKLASFGDAYVNDAFPVSHRSHASIVGIPKFIPGFMGFQFQKEVDSLSRAFNPPRPFLFILGGAKFDTKFPLVTKFLDIADSVFVGGALANDLLKAKGLPVGKSLISSGSIDFSKIIAHKKIIIPTDVAVQSPHGVDVKPADKVQDDESIFDVGEETTNHLEREIKKAQCILWNGPLGLYEKGFKQATLRIAKAVSDSPALTIVGGGDTLAAILELKLADRFSFLSTGGGAMLDFLAQGTLPGIDALKK